MSKPMDNTVNGKAGGAGSRSGGSFPGQGANQNTGRIWSPRGNGYWEDGKFHNLNAERSRRRLRAVETSTAPCWAASPRSPSGRILVLGVVFFIIVYYIQKAWQNWLDGS